MAAYFILKPLRDEMGIAGGVRNLVIDPGPLDREGLLRAMGSGLSGSARSSRSASQQVVAPPALLAGEQPPQRGQRPSFSGVEHAEGGPGFATDAVGVGGVALRAVEAEVAAVVDDLDTALDPGACLILPHTVRCGKEHRVEVVGPAGPMASSPTASTGPT